MRVRVAECQDSSFQIERVEREEANGRKPICANVTYRRGGADAANQKDHKRRIGEKERKKTSIRKKYFISTLLHITVPETAIYIECAGKRDQSTTLIIHVCSSDILRTSI